MSDIAVNNLKWVKWGGTYLAEVHLVVHLSLHMMHIVVNHRQRGAYRNDGDHRKANGRIGDEAIGLYAVLQIHAVEWGACERRTLKCCAAMTAFYGDSVRGFYFVGSRGRLTHLNATLRSATIVLFHKSIAVKRLTRDINLLSHHFVFNRIKKFIYVSFHEVVNR